jgi:hypothetical protein
MRRRKVQFLAPLRVIIGHEILGFLSPLEPPGRSPYHTPFPIGGRSSFCYEEIKPDAND